MSQMVKVSQINPTQSISIDQNILAKPTTVFDVVPGPVEQVITPPVGYVFSGGVVGAIPDNYGLIAWDGSTLTIS